MHIEEVLKTTTGNFIEHYIKTLFSYLHHVKSLEEKNNSLLEIITGLDFLIKNADTLEFERFDPFTPPKRTLSFGGLEAESLSFSNFHHSIQQSTSSIEDIEQTYPDTVEKLYSVLVRGYIDLFLNGDQRLNNLLTEDKYLLNQFNKNNNGLFSKLSTVEIKLFDFLLDHKKSPQNPLVEKYQTLFNLVKNLDRKPDCFKEIIDFWRKEEEYFNAYPLSKDDVYKMVNKPLVSINYFGDEEYPYSCEKYDWYDAIHYKQLELYRTSIAEKLFQHFLKSTNSHLDMCSQGFPIFFQFVNWIDINKLRKHFLSLTPEHLDVLEQYKNDEGFAHYRHSIFYNSKKIFVAEEEDPVFATISRNYQYEYDLDSQIEFLYQAIEKNHNYNKLFNNDSSNTIGQVFEDYIKFLQKHKFDLPTERKDLIPKFQELGKKWSSIYLNFSLSSQQIKEKKSKI